MTALISITLPDGSSREVAPGTTPADIAAAIGPGLAKAALAARVDGELVDINRPLERDASLALVTAKDEADALELARRIVSVAPLGVRNILKNSRIADREGEPAAKKTIFQDVATVMKSEDMKEGLQSFIERRAAVFKGK